MYLREHHRMLCSARRDEQGSGLGDLLRRNRVFHEGPRSVRASSSGAPVLAFSIKAPSTIFFQPIAYSRSLSFHLLSIVGFSVSGC